VRIVPADATRRDAWLALRLALWPDCPRPESALEIEGILRSCREAAFLALDDAGAAAGFAEVSTRPYADGCHASPVGYLEGIYVVPGSRNRGVGRALVRECERWARSKGCSEMGSDALLDNTGSQAFHRAAGFREVERQVVFAKSLGCA
jgi:aminoglycoside 6'-N-acetyltransferase I